MTVSHVHLVVRDLPAAIEWFRRFLDVSPDFANEGMASLRLEGLALVLDQGEMDSTAILAVAAESCDIEVARLVERGALVTEAAMNRPWGVRNAYLAGPGAITLEVEETLAPEEG
jgi:catechol 2,3-dioxygenase-like lactoylglutathione lyase family enzyme